MVKHRLRESIKSLFRSHIDLEKEEQLKGAKRDIQDKVKRILRLVKEEHLEEDGTSLELSKKESLVKLIEEFHNQYQSIHSKYYHLTDELRKKIIGKRENGSFSSSSDSESDYSSMDKDSKNGQLENEFQRIINGMKQELEMAHMEVAELDRKLTVTSEEKEHLNTKYLAALDEIQKITGSRRIMADQQKDEKIAVLKELEAVTGELSFQKQQLEDRERQISELTRMHEEHENETSNQIKALEFQVTNLKLELESLQSLKGDQVNVLQHEVKTLQQQKSDLEVQLEEKIFESSEHVIQLQTLKEEVEEKADEIGTLLENVRMLEVNLRMSNQKLRVTEQLLREHRESFGETVQKFQKDQQSLEDKLTTLSATIAAKDYAYQETVTRIKESVNNVITGTENLVSKFSDEYKNYDNRISTISHELQIVKNYVREMNKEKAQLKDKIQHLTEQLQDKKEQELAMRKMVGKLEEKSSKEELDKRNLTTTVVQLQKTVAELEKLMKEKDEGILDMAEKREAIRQLCLGIDYHRNRYDYLKDVLSMTRRDQRVI